MYDSVANTWTAVGAIHDNRRNEAGALLPTAHGQQMYILGGYGEASQFILHNNVHGDFEPQKR